MGGPLADRDVRSGRCDARGASRGSAGAVGAPDGLDEGGGDRSLDRRGHALRAAPVQEDGGGCGGGRAGRPGVAREAHQRVRGLQRHLPQGHGREGPVSATERDQGSIRRGGPQGQGHGAPGGLRARGLQGPVLRGGANGGYSVGHGVGIASGSPRDGRRREDAVQQGAGPGDSRRPEGSPREDGTAQGARATGARAVSRSTARGAYGCCGGRCVRRSRGGSSPSDGHLRSHQLRASPGRVAGHRNGGGGRARVWGRLAGAPGAEAQGAPPEGQRSEGPADAGAVAAHRGSSADLRGDEARRSGQKTPLH